MAKDFRNNPAMKFLSEMEQNDNAENAPVKNKTSTKTAGTKKPQTREAKKIMITPPPKPELKSKQIHLLLTPSNLEKIQKLAKDNGRSVNDYLNCIIEQL